MSAALASAIASQSPLSDADLTLFSPAYLARRRRARRWVDLAVSVPALVFTLPVSSLVALGIFLVDPGPVLFSQIRVGLDGAPFSMVKFRSMYRDADDRLETFLAAHPERRVEWERVYKIDNDPRVLPVVGDFLRRFSLDELPNLLNVVCGQMTLVGPRPFPEYHLASLPTTLRRLRQQVTPGLTGVWQIVRGDLDQQIKSDLFYLRNTSGRFDARLVLQTAPLLFKGKKHY